jgi:hypothetical protein
VVLTPQGTGHPDAMRCAPGRLPAVTTAPDELDGTRPYGVHRIAEAVEAWTCLFRSAHGSGRLGAGRSPVAFGPDAGVTASSTSLNPVTSSP